MKGKRIGALVLALALLLSGCSGGGGEGEAAVQSVAMIVGADLSGTNQYNGVTEARATVKVQKDGNKTVKECLVKPGDQVEEGDTLFIYDTDALELTVTSAELEVEQLRNTITNYDTQIAALEKEKSKAPSSEQLSYTLQIQEAELNKSETEYNLKQKEAELQKLKDSAGETEVYASVSGVIQSVQKDGGGGGEGESDAYITIMETGTYRIKGTASEESIRGITEGMEMTAYSRLDSAERWHGYVESINTGSAESQNSSGGGYYDGGGGESSSKYVFYVTLDSSDGLLIGQHVYLKPGSGEEEDKGIQLPAGYLLLDEDIAAVWAVSGRDRLERRNVTLGQYDEEEDTYVVAAGLSLQDYIAYPEEDLHEGMKVVRYDEDSFTGEETGFAVDNGDGWTDEDLGGEVFEDGVDFGEGEVFDGGEVFEDGDFDGEEVYVDGEDLGEEGDAFDFEDAAVYVEPDGGEEG